MGQYVASETLEEGEIVDDDNLEDISDNSITGSMGKFLSPNERLRALSLSSVSDAEVSTINVKKCRKRRRNLRHDKKRKLQPKQFSDSSDDDNYVSKELKDKLKEAISINENEDLHRNSLQTRLKGMGKGKDVESVDSTKQQEVEIPIINVTNNNSNELKQVIINNKIDDPELENLRLEALKTAVINKSKKRKRRKALQNGLNASEILDDKENDTETILVKDAVDDVTVKKPCLEQNDSSAIAPPHVPPSDLEDDEDVLRASLLAGLAKKITKMQNVEQTVNIPQFPKVPPKRPPLPITTMPKIPAASKLVVNNLKKDARRKLVVKPLIIKVNNDSDSDDDQPEIPQTVNDAKKQLADIDKFLKEQREKFEQEAKKAKLEKPKVLDKSAVKLLPKSRQIEYQQLLKRLKNAEKRKILGRLEPKTKPAVTEPNAPVNNNVVKNQIVLPEPSVSIAISPVQAVPTTNIAIENLVQTTVKPLSEVALEATVATVSNKPTCEVKDEVPFTTMQKSLPLTVENCDQISRIVELEKRNSGVTNELTTLKKTLNEIRAQRKRSFQMISKYQVLTPIMKKITEARNEQKKHETHIRYLLRDLGEARNKLSRSHDTFSSLVRKLVDTKATIDQSCGIRHTSSTENCRELVKKGPIIATAKINLISDNKIFCKTAPVTSTPVRIVENLLPFEDSAISGIINSDRNSNCEDMELCSNGEETIIDIVDPNDIDQIFKNRPSVTCNIPEYVSPLNNGGRYNNVDPLGILCPYEVNGSCRDSDCTFKHYLKNHQESQ